MKTQQIIAYDTTEDDCNGVDLITILNCAMHAGCIDSIPGDELEELMKCSYQFGSNLDQSKLVNWLRSVPVQGVRFSCAFHFRSQVGKRVREMINSLTTHLKEENSEDIEHKVWCATELTTNTQPGEEKTAIVEKLHATVDELEASMENLAVKVANLFAQVSNQVSTIPS